ncbi:hypothetical protein DSLASN_12200 [Desulfoluna limicola]|uniref:Polysaccharide pyruvyl transferase domain-containing protein n=1 Tax=Desulfoluna limicola TaxID=2810562 RepID=A0ABM7PED3_9BACT|nr:polysaccharide pyruvyl transferase family protein [Desulfoluna limicola]BCS95588.1 hypothetical protein DSLASN_12200 [Desulfoluna limicola]
MKIGIITFLSDNYGAALQAWALQRHLKSMGHEVYIISYRHALPSGVLKSYLGRTPFGTYTKWFGRFKKLRFDRFRLQHLNLTDQFYESIDELRREPPEADIYICGSDQIWNPNFAKSMSDQCAYWLDFGVPQTKKIAYAASFGVQRLRDQNLHAILSSYLKKFAAVGVREYQAIGIIEALGKEGAHWVPDPTLLLKADDYNELAKLPNKNRPYFFAYILGDRQDLIYKIKNFIHSEYNLQSRIPFIVKWWRDIRSAVFPTPQEWLGYIRESKFVVTNSFHGTIFSILYRKPFVTIPIAGKGSEMNDRIISLLERLGIEDRILWQYDEIKLKKLFETPVKWGGVEQRIEEWRKDAQVFLTRSIEGG